MKQFEDYFAELQTDMVSISLEYVNNKVDNIYIYCSYEPEAYYFNVFYRINGQLVHKHELNNISKEEYDISIERQKALMKIGREDLERIHDICKEYKREMPAEMKLYYDVKLNKLQGKYQYDLVYSQTEDLLPNDIFNSWFEEIRANQKI
ncbi:DUF600 domain-containing protein [Sporolactobacillus sp. CQH2019]|uniref:DUF600 domain-containing protein n=1 Tax=Sporolactobacillus sp. CQH2019 TaxID=3023512 RepID=UPI002367B197|nr:DUF600 domain-containing protein [Sporolactobacillus sp. CQH2019]MDD9149856.1 DUF600 domain-containing protein [Sporolactobacillus sp. CQH2019]